jgi:hypothetical protein
MPGDATLKERIEALEARTAVLSDRAELLQSFVMAAILPLSKDQQREALRSAIERKIRVAGKSMQLDALHDLQDLLRAFDIAMAEIS